SDHRRVYGMDLFTSIDSGDLPAVLDRLDSDPDAAHRRHDTGPTPLLYALYRGRNDIARALAGRVEPDLAQAAALDDPGRQPARLHAGADPDARPPDGYPPLQLAAFFGAPASAALLIERGADVDAVADNPMRIQPLHAAAAGRHRQIALALIAA